MSNVASGEIIATLLQLYMVTFMTFREA